MKILFLILLLLPFSTYAKGSTCWDLFGSNRITVENFDLTISIRGRVFLAHLINEGEHREADGSRTHFFNTRLHNGQLYRAIESQVNFRSKRNLKRVVMVKIPRELPVQKSFLWFSWKAKLSYATLERAKILSEKIEIIRDMDGSVDSYRLYDVQFDDGVIGRVRAEFVTIYSP